MTSAHHLLIVDDEPDFREALNLLLAIEGFRVTEATSGPDAIAALDRGLRPDLLVLDQRMPGLTGAETLEAVRSRGLTMPAILVTAASNGPQIAQHHDFAGYLAKPFNPDVLLQRVRTLLRPGSGANPP